jgi:hypothetical protein
VSCVFCLSQGVYAFMSIGSLSQVMPSGQPTSSKKAEGNKPSVKARDENETALPLGTDAPVAMAPAITEDVFTATSLPTATTSDTASTEVVMTDKTPSEAPAEAAPIKNNNKRNLLLAGTALLAGGLAFGLGRASKGLPGTAEELVSLAKEAGVEGAERLTVAKKVVAEATEAAAPAAKAPTETVVKTTEKEKN